LSPSDFQIRLTSTAVSLGLTDSIPELKPIHVEDMLDSAFFRFEFVEVGDHRKEFINRGIRDYRFLRGTAVDWEIQVPEGLEWGIRYHVDNFVFGDLQDYPVMLPI
jgi:hypothetical protein